jgi:hypothetical protein
MRPLAIGLLIHFVAVLFAPAVIVADFWLEKERIEREVCVQRMVDDGERTCHGQCYLMKRLDRMEQRAHELPQELRSFQLGDMAAYDQDEIAPKRPVDKRDRPRSRDDRPLSGHRVIGDPVPWG